MVKALLCLLPLLAASPALAQGSSYQVLGEARKTVTRPALVERYGPDPIQHGELRLPAGKGPFPVAVVLHGGCWSAAMEDASGTAPLADALTARGIATWNLEYRRLGNPGGGYPGTFADIAAGVDYLRTLARTQKLDLTRVAVVGHSSGAHLALWAASRARLGGEIAGAAPLPIAAVVAIDGPGALAPLVGPDAEVCRGQPVIAPFMGGTPAALPDAYRFASPQDHLPLGVPQYFVLGALTEWMAPYVAAARESGDPVAVLASGGADHFNIITPTTPQGRDVIDFIVRHAFSQ
ncbi:alpha/beta hydrolase family protein [Sphingomonas sp. CJ20]